MMCALLIPSSTLKIIGVFNLTHKYMEEQLTCYFLFVCVCVKMGGVPVEHPVFACAAPTIKDEFGSCSNKS